MTLFSTKCLGSLLECHTFALLHKQPKEHKDPIGHETNLKPHRFTGIAIGSYAQQVLTLDSCRTLALANNKELRISQEKINAARYQKKAAFTNFLPKIDVMGAYMRTQKEISLLSDEQKQTISNIGTATGAQLQEALQQLGASNPMLGSLLQPLAGMIPGLSAGLNGIGQGIVDAFRTDTRNMTLGTATLTQPLFMGGKIIAYNKITKYAEQLAQSQHATGMQDLILNTDQAYWQVISLVNKKNWLRVTLNWSASWIQM